MAPRHPLYPLKTVFTVFGLNFADPARSAENLNGAGRLPNTVVFRNSEETVEIVKHICLYGATECAVVC